MDLITTEEIWLPTQAKFSGEITFECEREGCDRDVIVELHHAELHEIVAVCEEESRGLCHHCLKKYNNEIEKHFHLNY